MSAHPTFPAPTQPITGTASLPKRGEIFDGKYRIDDVLGIDGNGAVLAATRLDRGERVAIKVLLPEAVHDTELIARCAREGRASSRLRPESIARASEAGLFQGRPYLVLEYADGSGGRALADEGGIHRGAGTVRLPPSQPQVMQAQRAAREPTLRRVPSARAALAEPTRAARAGSTAGVSVPPPPMRSALPGYLLAVGSLAAIVAIAGGVVWHQSRALHRAEARVDPPTLAPAFHIPPVPHLPAATPTDQVTTTSAVITRTETAQPVLAQPAAVAPPLAPAPVAAPVDPPVAVATPAKHHHHHHAQPRRDVGARAAAPVKPANDDDNPYATMAAAPADPAQGNNLFEIRK